MSKEHFYQTSKEILKANNKFFGIRPLAQPDREKAKAMAKIRVAELKQGGDAMQSVNELIRKTEQYLQELETQKEVINELSELQNEGINNFRRIYLQEIEFLQNEIMGFIGNYVLGDSTK